MLLTKPGIILGNILTVLGGFFLGARGQISWLLLLATVIGLGLIIASSCVFNNYIDRNADAKMGRTKNRALATQSIPHKSAIVFAIILGLIGVFVLAFTNMLALTIAIIGFLFYVILYSFSKYYTRYGTLIGSIAGAVPPVVGYTAASNQFDLGAFLLFVILVLWQMPHFYAIAIYRQKEYAKADIPVLPLVKGTRRTKIHMLFYCIAFLAISPMLSVAGYTGGGYQVIAVVLGIGWLWFAIQGFNTQHEDAKWARKMFVYSLFVITVLSITMMFDYR